MRDQVRTSTAIVATAVITATAFSAGPTVARAAYDAVNAEKVDGKSAVGFGATPAQRAGKLVATNRAGMLPNDIIAKAPNADTVDGLDSTELKGERGPEGPEGPEGPVGPQGPAGVGLPASCAEGEVAKWNGTGWACAEDSNTVPEYQRVTGGVTYLQPQAADTVAATCPNGTVPLGGGPMWVSGSLSSLQILSSFPTATGWGIFIRNNSTSSPPLQVAVIVTCGRA